MITITLAQLYSKLQPPDAEPLSIEALSAAINHKCSNVSVRLSVLNPVLEEDCVERFIGEVSRSRSSVVGLSVPQGTLLLAQELLTKIKETSQFLDYPLVILGHAIPTYSPETLLTINPEIIAVRGWGEDAIISILEQLQGGELLLDRIPGIIYLNNNQTQFTPIDHKIVPYPPLRICSTPYFRRVEFSRGCHYGRCTFCSRPPGEKRYWQRIPVDTVLDSITSLRDKGILNFTFSDEDFFGLSPVDVKCIVKTLSEMGDMRFSISARADDIYNPRVAKAANLERHALIESLKKAGLSLVFIGVESLSDSQLTRFGKGFKASDAITAIRILESSGVSVEAGFILFDPFVSMAEIAQNYAMLTKYGIWKNVSNLFSLMRLQSKSAISDILMGKGLAGPFDANRLCYDWRFDHNRIHHIYDRCSQWSLPFHNIHRLIRNKVRTDFRSNQVMKYVYMLRSIDIAVLGRIIHDSDELCDEPTSFFRSYHEARTAVALDLLSYLSQLETGCDNILKQELRSFLSRSADQSR